MTLDRLIELLNEHGFSWVISLLTIYFIILYVNRQIKKMDRSGQPVHVDMPFDFDIQRHSVLNTLEVFYQNNIHIFCFANPFKQLLWTDFLGAYFRAMHTYLHDGLDRDFHHLPGQTFRTEVSSWFTGLFPYCEQAAKAEIAEHLRAPNCADPAEIIVQKFKTVFRENNTVLFTMLAELTDSPAMLNNKQRLSAVLYALKGLLYLIMQKAEKTLRELNGDLDGFEYKGVVNDGEPHH